ncbi:hypothetical protein NDU88_010908 [Pleurodeles waltl]|uniref:Uncharacterized protein n=1 Tax=Pleurodeles waltl TaxID=8319 RepID=A0AAV7S0Z4_PLEWA|nr:hypothetical protein NDU88_010908 [Pleurodeles waltl]
MGTITRSGGCSVATGAGLHHYADAEVVSVMFLHICWGLARNLTIGDEGGPTTIGSATTRDCGAPSGEQKGRRAPRSFAYLQEKPTVPGKRRIPAAGAARSGVPKSTRHRVAAHPQKTRPLQRCDSRGEAAGVLPR